MGIQSSVITAEYGHRKARRKVTGIISYHLKDAYNMYPFVSGEFTPLEYYTNVSSNRFSIIKADTLKKE